MIEAVYISHTQECSGWDLDSIIEGTAFKKGCRTMRFPRNEEAETIKMLDWDFREAKNDFSKVWERHLEISKSYDFEIIFAPDSFTWSDSLDIIDRVKTLKQYCKRIVVPLHGYFSEYETLELGFPIAGGFNPAPKNWWLWDLKEKFTHILGGSPHTHLRMLHFLPKISTVDGNQMFWCAVRFGKYWDGKWIKPKQPLSNEECFKLNVANFQKVLEVAF